jgi:hypothetical protein
VCVCVCVCGGTEEERKKLGFVTVTANAGDVIIMPLRLLHAVMPWQPTDRDRVVLFYTYIPQFYYSEKPPTTITTPIMQSAGTRAASQQQFHRNFTSTMLLTLNIRNAGRMRLAH